MARSLSYFLVRYPQKSKVFVSEEANNLLYEINNSSLKEFSMLRRLDVHFNPYFGFDKKQMDNVVIATDYSRTIKQFLNKLITAAKTHLPQFRRLMTEVFTIGEDKRIVDNLCGMKFKEDMPLYTGEEMQ